MTAERKSEEHPPITDPEVLLSITQAMLTLWHLMPAEHRAGMALSLLDRMSVTEWQPWLKKELTLSWVKEPDRDTEIFPVTVITRQDVEKVGVHPSGNTPFEDDDMRHIARKMRSYMTPETFWDDLKQAAQSVAGEKGGTHPAPQ